MMKNQNLTVYILLLCCLYRIVCSDECNVTITKQSELDQFLNSATSRDKVRCVHLSLAAGNSYKLNIVKFMQINLEHNASLIVVGEGGGVDINCTASLSDLEELRKLNLSLSRASLVLLDGLVFTSCPVPIVIEEVLTVVINNCYFLHQEHGAVSIYNSQDVTVKNCKFLNNTSDSYFTRRPYQGSSAGLSIGYHYILSKLILHNVSVLVTGCTFINNYAAAPTALRLTSTEIFRGRIFSGRGASMSILVNINTALSFILNSSIFVNNSAYNLAGGIYCLAESGKDRQSYLWSNNVFIGNRASLAGVLNFISTFNFPIQFVLNYTVYNCTFSDNVAHSEVAGAATIYPLYGLPNTLVVFEDCKFYNNSALIYGGAVDIASYNFFAYRILFPVEFINCVFDGNIAADGSAINIAYYSARFENVTFSRNKESAVRSIAGKIDLQGNVTFHNNTVDGSFGGALYLLSSSQVVLQDNTHVMFTNNNGRLGASIVSEIINALPLFRRSYHNPLCFLQYYNTTTPFSKIDDDKVSMTFTDNNAIVGSAIFANELDFCSWFSYSEPFFYFDASNILRSPFIIYNEDRNSTSKNKVVPSAPVITPAINFIILNDTIKAYPGEPVNLVIIPHDEQNFIGSDMFELQGAAVDSDVSFSFSPTVRSLQPADLNYLFTYSIVSQNPITSSVLIDSHRISVSAFGAQTLGQIHQFNLTIAPCPPGHALHLTGVNDEHSCRCNEDREQNIISCLPHERKVVLKDGYWAHAIDTVSVNGEELIYYWCPPGYCQCVHLNNDNDECSYVYYDDDEDRQCVCDREGYLCGKCRDDKGVSGLLNNCVECGHVNTMLIVALVAANIIVISLILLSSATLVPWFYPFLYYIQVTPHVAQYFPVTFSAVQPYLHYISSAISLYFPYDFCLYPGMTALVSYSIRYIPFVLGVTMSTFFYTIHRKFNITMNVRLSWSGLWLLIMLLYTDVVNTSVSVLNCPILKDHDGELVPRWFVDGTVKCFTGGHVALALFAVLVLTSCVVLIVVVMAITVGKLKRLSVQRILREPFSDHCQWWAPVDLIRRTLFIIFIVIDPGNLVPVLLLTMTCVAVYAYYQPYQKQYINVLEIVILVDQLLLLMMAPTSQFKDVVYGADHSFSIDQCGHVDTISTHVAILTPFYYFPVVMLCVVVVVKIIAKIKASYTTRVKGKYHAMLSVTEGSDTIATAKVVPTSYYIEFTKDSDEVNLIKHTYK
ncbi:uncharacterized protein [Dysidea avara]|uniref:uncharacterized protein n=1 Tax=Dysidea avara TaxID=196820 RepID=UPI00331C9E0F